MIKCLVIILLVSVFTVNSYSQKVSDSLLLSRYSISLPTSNSNFLIVQLAKNTPSQIVNEMIRYSERKFSDDIYIISGEKLYAGILPKKYIARAGVAANKWKLSPSLEKWSSSEDKKKLLRFIVQFADEKKMQSFLNAKQLFSKEKSYQANRILSFISSFEFIEKNFLNNPDVTGIDILTSAPREELAIKGFDLSTNQLNLVHAQYPLMKGEGQHASVKENYYDTADIDLRGRLDPSPLASSSITNHANFMATIIAGAGNSVHYATGAAPAAHISSSSFDAVLPDPDTYYLENNITVQNHSYGTSIDNSYGLNAVAFDNSAYKNESLSHVFSSGNLGSDTSKDGNYKGIAGYANITGNFKMAKNSIVVGASDSSGNGVPQSSAGPAYDGRILPHIVAFQMNGTSESAALVSGTILLLQQLYLEKNKSVCPSPLVKAILINSADDTGIPGPDFKTGFGNMNALKAMNCIKENHIFSGVINSGETDSFHIAIPANCRILKVTLAWMDTTNTAFAPKALVNDLDLEIDFTTQKQIWKPWVLNSFPDEDSLAKPAERKRDSLNNQEQVSLENPVAGSYTIKVNGYSVISPKQKYYIAYSIDTTNYFQWQLPTRENFVEKGMPAKVKWQTSFSGKGTIEYKFTGNENWEKISDNDLSHNTFIWTVPDTLARALLRIKIGNDYFYSDTFLITKLVEPFTGLICSDSILIYWNAVKDADSYKIFRLGEKYMEPFKEVRDSFAVIFKNETSNHFFAVAPVFHDHTTGTKSYAFDYTLQGAGCFINSFYVNLQDNNAVLNLSLGTLYNIANIEFEKLKGDSNQTIFKATIDGLNYSFTYPSLQTGIHYFRTKITLKNGVVIYSNIEKITFVERGKYLLLPVPVNKNSPIHLYTSIPGGEVITITDAMGRIVIRKEIQFTHEYIETSVMLAGQYFYRITKDGKSVASGKLLVL